MIQTSKEARLLNLLTSAITSACANPDGPVKYAKQDVPLTVRVASIKNGFEITDEHHLIPCEFSKGSLFWFKMENPKMSVKDLKDQFLVLNEYKPASILTDKKELEICLHIHSFTLVPKDEVKETKSPSKLKEVTKDKEMETYLDMLRRAHLRRALMKEKDPGTLPNLEELLAGTGGKTSGKKAISPITEVKGDKEGAEGQKPEDRIVEFKDIDKVEEELKIDVELLLGEEEKKRSEIAAGSEGEPQRKSLLEALAPKMKDQHLVELMKNRGVLTRARTPSKVSPKKKGKMPEELKEAVKEVTAKAKVEKGGKRKKPEGKKSAEEKGEKKAAVEEEGKRAGYTLRAKGGKKKGAK